VVLSRWLRFSAFGPNDDYVIQTCGKRHSTKLFLAIGPHDCRTLRHDSICKEASHYASDQATINEHARSYESKFSDESKYKDGSASSQEDAESIKANHTVVHNSNRAQVFRYSLYIFNIPVIYP
jgi:hypothetical protein